MMLSTSSPPSSHLLPGGTNPGSSSYSSSSQASITVNAVSPSPQNSTASEDEQPPSRTSPEPEKSSLVKKEVVGGTPTFDSEEEKATFEADKRTIYKHPMFPLLALLFEKCEQATQSADCPSAESFNRDIQDFVDQQRKDEKPLLSKNGEADELMIKAIQVLRIHLLELEKVQELCKDFCNRYITCLKGKMQSENLLRSDYGGYDSDDDVASVASSSSSSVQVHQQQQQRAAAEAAISSMAMAQHYMQQQQHQQHQAAQNIYYQPQQSQYVDYPNFLGPSPATAASTPISASVRPTMVAIDPNLLHLSSPSSSEVTTPLLAPNSSERVFYASVDQTQPFYNMEQVAFSILSDSFDDDSDETTTKSTNKRGNIKMKPTLPKQATAILKSWLFQNFMHPYPSDEDTLILSRDTGLTLGQINSWFVTARRRLLKPKRTQNGKVGGEGDNSFWQQQLGFEG